MKKTLTGLAIITGMAFQAHTAHAQENVSVPAQHAEVSQKINLNTASVDELTALPGIGKSKAQAIVNYRKDVGEFLEVEQLTEVKGSGPKMLSKIEHFVMVAN